MIEDLNLDPLPDLPDELAELDAELRDIRMAERPSFGPELRAELEQAWREGPEPEAGSAGIRRALAASIGAVLFAGLLVPPARAAIAEITLESLRLLGMAEERASAPATAVRSAPPMAANVQLPPATAGGDRSLIARSSAASPAVDTAAVAEDEVGDAEPTGELPRFELVQSTMPELVDRNADQEAIRRYYPPRLEEEGVGGSVFVRLWVDSVGTAHNVAVVGSSGYAEMDEAAVRAARDLRFRPATRGSRAVGTLVEFEMAFEPLPSARKLQPVDRPILSEGLDADFASLWPDAPVVPAPYQVEARELLRTALGRPSDLERRFGSVENLLNGEPPPGASPLRWRASATAALEGALERDPDNPAPYVALGRIRKRQGLRAEALSLFDEGAERAARGSRAVSPRLVAELNYERGTVLKEDWLGSRRLGRVAPEAVADVRCAARRNTVSVVDDLIGMNYLCPDEMRRLLEEGFRPADAQNPARVRMLKSFRAAVAAYPAHVGANLELLLDRADDGRWVDLLNGARAFAWASRGDAHALLLSGLALQRLDRHDEALDDFELAMEALPDRGRLLRDIGPLLSAEERGELAGLDDEAFDERIAAFWRVRDPIRLTEVNERAVEHLARTTWALLRLGGPDTEAGEVWIRYGRPAAIRAFGEGSELRTEFWDYGIGPSLTFRRAAGSAEPDLTPEARAYLGELNPALPHWYGRPSTRVQTLPAQVGRFRARGGEPAEVTVHTRLPAEMATGGSDRVELGLFVLGQEGGILSELRRSLPAIEGDVRIGAPVPDRAARVVLELHHPGLGQTMSVRSPVRRDRAEGEDPGISDLLLTDPARPLTREIRRGESWIVPRTDRGDASGDAVGLLFEIYDIGPDAEAYRLSVELEPRGRLGSIGVPIRPAGQDRFELAWPRTPMDAPEFLTMDLSAVGPGSYTLRVLVDGPGESGSMVAERAIER